MLHPPRASCEPEECAFTLAYSLLPCVLAIDLFYFSSLPSLFSISILDIVCFILSFSCGYYAVPSVSVVSVTRLAYDMYLDTYVR